MNRSSSVLFFPVLGTNSIEIQTVRADAISGSFFRFLVPLNIIWKRNVFDLSAFRAYYMVVFARIGVKSIKGAARMEDRDKTLTGKH